MSPELLAVIGSVNILLLSIIAYFFKGLVDGTNDIKLKLGILITKHDNTEKTAERNTRELEKFRDRLHKLEAQTLQVMALIEEYSKE
jgi:preprotein translocase subunit SecF